ncbi:MAG TPA: HAMP domain-containing sensor histidine kinase [Phycisphaerae bacterium]|nr:HAMP domain-containing sensor histidine kinase [Phycisphaerae bacterium]
MTLARRIVFKTILLTAALLAAGGGMVTAMLALQRLTASTREEFDELREVRRVDRHLQESIRAIAGGDRGAVLAELNVAIAGLAQFGEYQESQPTEFGPHHASAEESLGASTFAALERAARRLQAEPPQPGWAAAVHADLSGATETLDRLADEIEDAVAAVHARTAARFRATTWLLFVLALVSTCAGLLFSVLHYRSVVRPLRELLVGTRRLAQGDLAVRLAPTGDREFHDLKQGFNDMAAELEALCTNLEERVAEQSKELAVAERLASVGFLAAGVAHEINNPLAIMSGCAESLLRRLGADGSLNGEAQTWARDLEAIRDEAFRCKRITQGLLDLSRMGDPNRGPVSLATVVAECVQLLGSWPGCKETRIECPTAPADAFVVSASEQELKQVVLNLLVNAVEASDPATGRVELRLGSDNGDVTLQVIDNGRGMTPETLDRVFEPFFTTGKGRRGHGLGLSISHAIVQRQGGTLTAHSAGPGRGSRFLLSLPALTGAKS